MAETTFHFDTDISFAGFPGMLPLKGPFPKLGGNLYGAYLLGRSFAKFARGANAEVYGPRFDWSGNGRHLATLGAVSELFDNDGLIASAQDDRPKTPFSANDILAVSGTVSVVTIATTVSTAPTVAFARPGKVDPTFAATLAPTTADYRTSVTIGGTVTAQIGALTNELNNRASYGSTFTNAERWAYSKFASDPTKEATENTAKTLSSSLPFEIGETGGQGTGNTFIHGMVFYSRAITKLEFEAVHTRFRGFLEAIGNSLLG